MPDKQQEPQDDWLDSSGNEHKDAGEELPPASQNSFCTQDPNSQLESQPQSYPAIID